MLKKDTRSAVRRSAAGAGGAVQSQAGRRQRLGAWLRNHRDVAVDSLRRMASSYVGSAMTCLVIGIALALPAWMYLALANLGDISGNWTGPSRVTVYLESDVEGPSLAQLREKVSAIDGVRAVRYVSAEDALADFEATTGLTDILAALPSNPLPATLLVDPSSAAVSDVRRLSGELERLEGVEAVSIDLVWVERLNALLRLGKRIVIALSVILATAVVLVIGNTIRLMIEGRRAEIEVVKLVGGTSAFVRRPFLYTGMWYGLVGGVTGFLLIEMSLLWLLGPVSELLGLYGSEHRPVGIGAGGALAMVAGAGLLGLAGAWVAVSRHLDAIEPG